MLFNMAFRTGEMGASFRDGHILRTLPRLIGKDHLPAALVRHEEPLPVAADEPPKPLPHVEDADLHRSMQKSLS